MPTCSHPSALRTPDGTCVLCTTEPSPAPSPTVSALAALPPEVWRAEQCRRSFRRFVAGAWPTIEPTRALLPGVAIDAMTAALQAVGEGRIRRLAIATCPGTSKSLITAVAYPAWLLLRSGGTQRIMVGSYAWDFASRDSRRCRDLITSPWYRSLVADAWSIRDDADKRDDYWTTSGGRRLIVSVGGKTIGERCTTQIIDDALSGADVYSPAAKKVARDWISTVLPSRLEDPDHDARVIVGQRLAVDDPVSVAIEQGWRYLYLPAVLAAGDERCELRDDAGTVVWRDERTPGEPLVSLLSPEALARLKTELGSGAFATQYLQRPSDDSSATIKRSWWRFHAPRHIAPTTPRPAGCVETLPVETPTRFDRIVIAVDMTFGGVKSSNDYGCAQVWGAVAGARYLIEQWRGRCSQMEQRAAIKTLARKYPSAKVLIEKAAGGAGAIEELTADGIPNVIGVTTGGKGKGQRIGLVSPTIEAGNAILPLGAAWLGDYVEELAGATRHDDAQDCTAYALHALNTDGLDDEAAITAARVRSQLISYALQAYDGGAGLGAIAHVNARLSRASEHELTDAEIAEHSRLSGSRASDPSARWPTILDMRNKIDERNRSGW